ncbi:SAF domain-containing protein [Xylariaceae sp. FL0255]|nr:SAF domain-containing protein [Xylariaceae sp. FL0255]
MTILSTKPADLEAAGKPIQVGIIRTGKFKTSLRLASIVDLSKDRALAPLKRTGSSEEKYDSTASLSISEGTKAGKRAIITDSAELIAPPEIDAILEVTGNRAAGIRHVLLCCEHKKHAIVINVKADVLAGPLLVRKAKEPGIIYSMAYGDVVCADEGIKHLPEYHYSNPDTVWYYYVFTEEQQLASGDFNPRMFNLCLDDGLKFPPVGFWDLPEILKPKGVKGCGMLEKTGTVEFMSSMEPNGRWVFNHLRWGVYIIIEARGPYQQDCCKKYGLKPDSTGDMRSSTSLTISSWAGDVVATAKRDLKAGEKLDGESGFIVYGKLKAAATSIAIESLPVGLAHGIVLKRDVKKDQGLRWEDVEYSVNSQAISVRREMEGIYRKEFVAAKTFMTNGVNGVH